MSYHSGPEYVAPDDLRCMALVKGQPSWVFEWMKHDHRCPRKANQMRGQLAVCYQHAQAKVVTAFVCVEAP